VCSSDLAQFERRYGPLILAYALKRGLQLSDAENIRQRVLIGLSRSLPTFTYGASRGRFRSYLGTAVKNAIFRHTARHAGHEVALSGDETSINPSGANSDAFDELWEHQWMLHHYRLALDELRRSAEPASVRVIEGFMNGRTTNEIAGALGLTPEATRKIKQRMKNKLMEIITKQIDDEQLGPDTDAC